MPGCFPYSPHRLRFDDHQRLYADTWGIPIESQRKAAWEARAWHCAWLCAGCLADKWQRHLSTILRALHLSPDWPIQAGDNTPLPYEQYHTRPTGRRAREQRNSQTTPADHTSSRRHRSHAPAATTAHAPSYRDAPRGSYPHRSVPPHRPEHSHADPAPPSHRAPHTAPRPRDPHHRDGPSSRRPRHESRQPSRGHATQAPAPRASTRPREGGTVAKPLTLPGQSQPLRHSAASDRPAPKREASARPPTHPPPRHTPPHSQHRPPLGPMQPHTGRDSGRRFQRDGN